MSVEIDTLEVEIQASSAQASTNISNLVSSLERLKTTAKGGAGLRTVSNQLNTLNTALKGLNDNSQKISSLVSALNSLGSIQKATGLSSTVNALKKLDSITEQLSSTDMDAFARQIQSVTNAISPLAAEMQKVSNGFAAFPIRIQKAIAASGQAQKSFGSLASGIKGSLAKLTILGYSVNQTADVISDWVKESNDYVENLNLFTVAMGDAADEAYEYAYAVNDALGIDLGVVQQGFGLQLHGGTGRCGVFLGAFKQFGARLLGGAQHLLRVGTQRCERIRIGLAILLLLQLRLKLQNGLVIGLHLLAKTVHRLLSGGERLVDPIFVVPPQHDWELVHHGAFLSRIPSLTLTFRALSVCTLAHPEHETHGSRIILTQRTGISQKSSTSSQQNVAG